jgi:hypothetical protein
MEIVDVWEISREWYLFVSFLGPVLIKRVVDDERHVLLGPIDYIIFIILQIEFQELLLEIDMSSVIHLDDEVQLILFLNILIRVDGQFLIAITALHLPQLVAYNYLIYIYLYSNVTTSWTLKFHLDSS